MSAGNPIVTVFGGSGFIGRHLIGRLARTGATVRVACRHPGEAAGLKMAGTVGQVVPWAVDVTRDESVDLAVRDADQVVNLIGILYEAGPGAFQAAHVDAAQRIARRARAAGAQRLVHISAIGARDDAPAAYARSKAAGEAAVRAAFPEATILRPSVVFGPEDNFFNKFAAMSVMAPALPLIGGGQTRFQPVYVGDVADAIMAALERGDVQGRVYELGGPRAYTFKELMQITLREVHRCRCLMTIPWKTAESLGGFLEKIPLIAPPLTRDQVELLKTDNVVGPDQPGLMDLGIAPTALEVIVPTYLCRFIAGGRPTARAARAAHR
jgi:NADH dehydrogenase